jgi:hypothetical protein
MTTTQAFLFGVMVAWSPSLLLFAWLLLPDRNHQENGERPDVGTQAH